MKTVLLADDEANLRMLVRTTLEGPDYRIVEAVDGTAALVLARKERPDLVILDWMMPGMTGVEVATALRRAPATAQIPILMLTAKGQAADREVERTLGLQGYLVKPFSPLELRAKVEQLLAGSRPPEHAGTHPVPEPSADVRREIDMANSQLALFARDLGATLQAERRKSEELAAANARLQVLDRLKSDFLAFISHELRTPLSHLSAFDLLDAEADPASQEEVIGIIREGYTRLEKLIFRGIEYLQWLTEPPVETPRSCELARVVDALLHCMPPDMHARVELELAPGLGAAVIHGDEEQLARVAKILLDNALKFSDADTNVRLAVRITSEKVVLSVTDRGRGFSPELAQEIFQPFTIADVAHHSQGTGLNLAIASIIVGVHGGSMRAESAGPGRGATFTVELPTAPAAKLATSGASPSPTAARGERR